jgi:hypothetical protein
MPRLEFDRKDRGGESIGTENAERPSILPENAFSVAVSWPPSLEPYSGGIGRPLCRLDLTFS